MLVHLRFAANVDGLKSSLPPFMRAQAGIPGSSCNDRYQDNGYFVRGTGGNQIDAGFNVSYQKWKCASASFPCPSFKYPKKWCRKDASGKIPGANASAHVALSLVANVNNGVVNITGYSHTTTSDIPKQLGFFWAALSEESSAARLVPV